MSTSVPIPALLRANEVAQMCGVTVETVKSWCKEGKLKHVRLSPHVLRIRQDDLVQFLESNSK